MIPNPWVAIVLALAAYRLTRLIGWDDFPPVVRVREWLVGEGQSESGWTYKRPLLAHFLHCAFCQGFWVSVAVYCSWLFGGHPYAWHSTFPAGYVLVPFALSAAVGLIAKNGDS